MRSSLPTALFAILIGAVEVAGALQEIVVLGFGRSMTEPLIIGALGTVAGALLLSAGVSLLTRSRLLDVLVRSTAYVSVPFFILSGIVKHYTAWPMTTVGLLYPLFLLLATRAIRGSGELRPA